MHLADHIVVHVAMAALPPPLAQCSLLVPLLTEYDGVIRELSQQGEVYKVCTWLGHWEMMEWRCVLHASCTCVCTEWLHRLTDTCFLS